MPSQTREDHCKDVSRTIARSRRPASNLYRAFFGGPPKAYRLSRHMRLTATNGLLIPLACAVFRACHANAGRLEATFFVAQGIERIAGRVNFTRLTQNMRGRMSLHGKRLAAET